MDWKTMLNYISGSVDEESLLRNGYLVAENRVLRNQNQVVLQLPDPFPQQFIVHHQAGYGRLQSLLLFVDDIDRTALQPVLASHEKRLAPMRQRRARDTVLPARRLQFGSTQQLQYQAHLAPRRPPALDAAQ